MTGTVTEDGLKTVICGMTVTGGDSAGRDCQRYLADVWQRQVTAGTALFP